MRATSLRRALIFVGIMTALYTFWRWFTRLSNVDARMFVDVFTVCAIAFIAICLAVLAALWITHGCER